MTTVPNIFMSDSAFSEVLQFPLKAAAFDFDFYCHLTETPLGASQVNLMQGAFWS